MVIFFVFSFLLSTIQDHLFAIDNTNKIRKLEKLAEKGDIDAQCELGDIYESLIYGSVDYKRAVYWYTKAAEQGNKEAQKRLASLYYHPYSGVMDEKKAAYWFTKAAKQGDTHSQGILARMYKEGNRISQDYKRAAYWYTKAAEQGVVFAQFELGIMYYNGQGVPQNYKLAYVWNSLAASSGDSQFEESARHNRDLSANKMTPQSLAEAQELAAKLQYKIDNQSQSPEYGRADPRTYSQYEPEAKGFGSGFIISKNGYILTCYHVIQGSGAVKVKFGENLLPAKVIIADRINDLALLKISGSFPALAFSSERVAAMGQEVFTIGYPNPIMQGLNKKLTKGSINSLTGFQDDIRLYQISIPVQPGNSGGPLLDMSGNIIGVIVAMLDAKTAFKISGSIPQNVNYAVKSSYAQAMLDTFPEVSSTQVTAHPKKPFDNVVTRVKDCVVLIVTYE